MECNICYETTHNIVHCFNKCAFKTCRKCFKHMLEIVDGEICYSCPMCRHLNIYNVSKNFTLFMKRGLDLLKIILVSYETTIGRTKTEPPLGDV